VRRIKLVVFDIDNVLFDMGYFEKRKAVAASTWSVIYEALGAQEEDEKLKTKWSTGNYGNQVHWASDAMSVFKRYGLTQRKYNKIIKDMPLMKGAEGALKALKEKGYMTAIISGSFRELGLRAHREMGIDFMITSCSPMFDKRGNLVDWDLLPCDYEGKVQFFNALISALKIKPKECAFVGDGVNDISLMKKVGLSIAFNARKELKEHCDVVVEGKDLSKILKYL
jgi:phosphoserine phosphatase